MTDRREDDGERGTRDENSGEESGEERQQRIQQEQHRPEQNDGYDQAVRRPREEAHDRPADERTRPPVL